MTVRYEVSEQVAEITIDRPDVLNALDIPTMRALRDAFLRARDDAEVRAIILTGAGNRAFCVGADLKNTFPTDRPVAASFWLGDDRAIDEGMYIRGLDLDRLGLWKPVIAAVNGHCVGGGFELALQCDIRIATDNATFGLPEAHVGSIPAIGGIQRLIRTVPHSVAMAMLFSGERISADEAYKWGVVSRLVPGENLLGEARGLASLIARNAPLALQAIKQLSVEGWNMPFRAALLMEQMAWGILRDTEDRIEGRRAFGEKRPAEFKGA